MRKPRIVKYGDCWLLIRPVFGLRQEPDIRVYSSHKEAVHHLLYPKGSGKAR